MTTNEQRQEASIPVQGRVNIVDLAELALLFEHLGYPPRTMSQLLNWSVDLLCRELRKSEKLPVEINSIAEAENQLSARRLLQRGVSRQKTKIAMAMGFETLRSEGKDPKDYAPSAYGKMHPTNQVTPLSQETLDHLERQKAALKEARERAAEHIEKVKAESVIPLEEKEKESIDNLPAPEEEIEELRKNLGEEEG